MEKNEKHRTTDFLKLQNQYKSYERDYGKGLSNFLKNKKSIKRDSISLKSDRVKICAAYLILHLESGKVYCGSTGDINWREYQHRISLAGNYHTVKKLQELFNSNNNIEFFLILVNDREEAFDLEQWLLDRYWNSGILLNTHPEARSPRGRKHSPEINLIRGESVSLTRNSFEFRDKYFRKIFIEGEIFHGIGLAADYFKLNASTIHRRLNNKRRFKNWYYLDSGPKEMEKIVSREKPVLIEGLQYPSINEAARQLNLLPGFIHSRIKSKHFKEWTYVQKSSGIVVTDE